MKYLAIPQQTADWILSKAGLLDALSNLLLNKHEIEMLCKGEFIEGPVRLSATAGNEVIALWNIDYLTGTGDEAWGYIKLAPPYGIQAMPQIGREVLERSLYVINQRQQGLMIDAALIHRPFPNGSHTCLSGRGDQARQLSIGYIERDVSVGSILAHSVICIGPHRDLIDITDEVEKEAKNISRLASTVSELISPSGRQNTLQANIFSFLRDAIQPYHQTEQIPELGIDNHTVSPTEKDAYKTIGWTYDEWIHSDMLSTAQKKLLLADSIERHPVRIIGPGGSGKTLLMQLLALRCLKKARPDEAAARIIYIVHNSAMAQMVKQRFQVLLGEEISVDLIEDKLQILTLAEYGRRELGLENTSIIDQDAHEAKKFQLEILSECLTDVMSNATNIVEESQLFRQLKLNPSLQDVIVRLVMIEISRSIKGHGITVNDEKRYVQSDKSLSILHGYLQPDERSLIFDVFKKYHNIVFEKYEVLDSDDVALSLLGRLRTPVYDLKRRSKGFDYIFVDETQLFNENERRIFPLLSKGKTSHVPIVLALDEAQDIYGQRTAGFSTLGIANIASENLASIHRSTREIIRLAFFVIQRTTDLFGPEFPDFTGIADCLRTDSDPLAVIPRIEIASEEQKNFGRFIVKRIRSLRRNVRRIAVICHAEQYWNILLPDLKKANLPLYVLEQRGERISGDKPCVVLSRPAHVGGQEFDAVLLVGLEHGLVPPTVVDNEALATAVEQQAIREIYLAITRARYRVIVALSAGTSPTRIINLAENAGLIQRTNISGD